VYVFTYSCVSVVKNLNKCQNSPSPDAEDYSSAVHMALPSSCRKVELLDHEVYVFFSLKALLNFSKMNVSVCIITRKE
jgi:hypothetical protein